MNQHCLKGKMLFEIGEIQKASEEFRYVIEKIVPDDNYSFLGLANITLKQALS